MPQKEPTAQKPMKMDNNFKKGLAYLLFAALAFISSMVGLDLLNQSLKKDIDTQAERIKIIEEGHKEEMEKVSGTTK